jgi:hypothetical protein
MLLQELIITSIRELFQEYTLISISGKAGTGKSSLSLYLIGNFLTSINPYGGSCVWVQASESFSKKRLESLFRGDKEKLRYLRNNIFITPGNGPFTSYEDQFHQLKKFSKKNFSFPPDIKFLVIDNISHHLRFKFSQILDTTQRSYLINDFYDIMLNPLIFRCQRENVNLILIHEVSFDVESQQTRPFFSKLYERIKGLHISLLKSFISDQRTIELAFNDRKLFFKFNLTDNGFNFSK